MRLRARALLAGLLLAVGSVVVVAGPALAQEQSGNDPTISHVSKECIDRLESGGDPADCQEAPSPILPATNEIIWGALSFLLLLLLMWRFAFPALKQGMDARAQRIRDNLDEAERTKADAQRILEDYQRQLADAKNESARIIEEARQTAEQLRRDLMARAEAEVQELRQRVNDDLHAAQERALSDVRAQVAELAIGAAEIVVQRNLDAETNRALVERFIEQVGSAS
jgi:F-type H+-transporting ATPase subunit b